MSSIFPYTEVDRRFYEERLRDHLPAEFVDIHTHVWLPEHQRGRNDAGRTVTWPGRVAAQQTIEDLKATHRTLFPDKTVTPLIFASFLSRGEDFAGGNGYVAKCAADNGYPAFLYARPDWSAETFDAEMSRGHFCGVKVYLSLSDPSIPVNDITILDFLPHHQLEVLNRRKLLVMLHIPRNLRARDPKNIEQILLIAEKYPDLRLIVAHAGRAYCEGDVGTAFDAWAQASRVSFDITANTNARVFERLLRAVGPDRILFGSDLPITRMRMKRIEENGRYVNLVPQGLYGDVSGDPNMREVPAAESAGYTLFLYEEIAAFLDAARATGLDRDCIVKVFNSNAHNLLRYAGFNLRRG